MTSRVLGFLAVTLFPMMLFEGAVPDGWAALPPLTYSAKPIRGIVVDAGTGQPLQGVIVVAQWVLHVAPVGYGPRLQVLEAVTDAQGVYQFPAWGPKLNPRFPLSSLDMRDPDLSFFKPGYRPHGASNMYMSNDSLRSSDWDGKTIKLEEFTGTTDEWAVSLASLQITLGWGDVFDWRLAPRIALTLELERLELENTPIAKRGGNIGGLSELGTTMEEIRRFLEGQK
jgi:hypothetical protein